MSVQVVKQFGLFLKIFTVVKNYQLFNPYWSIKSWSQTSKKRNYFNSFFPSKSTPLLSNSTVVPNSLQYFSRARLFSFCFNEKVILKIVNVLNKAHRHDDISIQMMKLCNRPVVKPLFLIFKNSIDTGTFPDIWKRMIPQYVITISTNIISVH